MVALEKALSAEKALAKRQEHKCVVEAKRRQGWLAKRPNASRAASRLVANGEESILNLESKIDATTTELKKYCKLAAKAVEKLKEVKADVALQSAPLKSTGEEMDTEATEMTVLQGQLVAKSSQFLQLSAKHVKLTDEISRVGL